MHLPDEIKKGLACNSVSKPDSILGRAVCLSVHPGRMVLFPFIDWFNKRYRGKYQFARLLFGFDLLLVGALIGIASVLLWISLTGHASFEDAILLEAGVAPREVIAGASSTLVIEYVNGTDEELRDAKLSLRYPDHFLLQALTSGETPVEGAVVSLGTIAAGARGSIHLKGVMFGDVGGEQAFTSTLTFVHGDARDVPSSKTVTHTFSPASSTLELTLNFPENLIAYQPIAGTITYRNTGEIAVPAVTIESAWPEGFTFTASDTPRVDGAFVLPAIEPGEQGAIRFEGFLGEVKDQIVFTFYPSFTFGQDRYRQETLIHAAPILPPQLTIAHGLSSTSVMPGDENFFAIRYENVGQGLLRDIILGIESDSPFFSKRTYEVNSATFPELAVVAPGATGEIQIPVRLRPTILQSEADVWEHLDLTTRPTASYALGDSEERMSSKGSSLASPITTPVTLTSFGRYAMPSGDQLGRGPLPPRVGEKTTYWVFWRVGGTINELTNVRLEGTLGDNVSFTGRQSSSQNSGVALDEAAGLIRWKLESIAPTLSPNSKVVGVAFELALTPNAEMIGKIPTLLSDIHLTAIDGRTGSFVSASGASVTTDLPDDLMASDKSTVSE